ncbi:MAG TPA: hypothetical protein VH022_06235, partial [Candidatus Acidoferrum sp.]|nr:hypothetical protein [Candidatus Acidoferrum sp.]
MPFTYAQDKPALPVAWRAILWRSECGIFSSFHQARRFLSMKVLLSLLVVAFAVLILIQTQTHVRAA